MNNALLACPFCGSEVRLELDEYVCDQESGMRNAGIICHGCKTIFFYGIDQSHLKLAERWNTRAPLHRCIWTEDADGNWNTDCDNTFILNDGTPIENNMLFCCYCGGGLVEERCTESAPTGDDDE